MLIYADFPNLTPLTDDQLEANYNVLQNGAVTTSNGKLISHRDVRISGKLGREVVLNLGRQISKYRLYLIDGRLFQLITAYDSNFADDAELAKSTDRFLDSFQLIEK